MNIEDIKIEDAADANYVIKKFFKNQLTNIKMDQLEQLVLTVYNMGKNKTSEDGSESSAPEAPPPAPENVNPFKINDRVIVIEDIEIGHSGEFIKTNSIGTVSSVKGEKISCLFESGEDGEMIDVSAVYSKFEKYD